MFVRSFIHEVCIDFPRTQVVFKTLFHVVLVALHYICTQWFIDPNISVVSKCLCLCMYVYKYVYKCAIYTTTYLLCTLKKREWMSCEWSVAVELINISLWIFKKNHKDRKKRFLVILIMLQLKKWLFGINECVSFFSLFFFWFFSFFLGNIRNINIYLKFIVSYDGHINFHVRLMNFNPLVFRFN